MIDVRGQRVILVSRLAGALEREIGLRHHVATYRRWASRGVLGPDGTRVKLETVRIGGGLYTTVEAVEEFARRLSAGRGPRQDDGARRPAAAAAADQCDKLGL